MPYNHSPDWSRPSTPAPDENEFSLPLPASATKASFGDVVNEKPPSASHRHSWFHGLSSIHAPILLVISLFPISTLVVFFAVRTLPITVAWPKTLTDLATLGRELHGYSQSGPGPVFHVIGVMAVTAVWKHAWSIPGSVIWNVLAGALFSPYFATILLTFLTTIGSLFATLLAAPLSPFIMHFLPKALDMTRSVLGGDASPKSSTSETKKSSIQSTPSASSYTSGAWVRLSILRLVGVVPWSGINIACGVCNVPLVDCFLGTFIGTLPWTAVTCQIGDILQTVASTPSPTPQTVSSLLLSPKIIIKLVFLSILSLAPILARDYLKALISPSEPEAPSTVPLERKSRWNFKKLRLSSRSRTREQREREERMKQLEFLVDEKRHIREAEIEMLPS
ncbi:hypothetical protein K435DRAFT_814893 [Dendrothele bispora CBS 962.96]|uniref:VTT domain-containing protein n=1 Tax=Dendrothele bispora (strain CBS 962.96) TaxID=1314807 RepID=A0A4S8MZ66_DENBC|nr:hypothetical protein K435DRAFT_814893 [Dendrothele bispora CBS 962.96]